MRRPQLTERSLPLAEHFAEAFAPAFLAGPGGAVGRVGVPHYDAIPGAQTMFFNEW